MTKSLPQKTHAETLIKVTEEYTLRPQKGDRARVCIATLQYLLDNFTYNVEYDADGWGGSVKCVETKDIEHLIYQLQKLK